MVRKSGDGLPGLTANLVAMARCKAKPHLPGDVTRKVVWPHLLAGLTETFALNP
ncbi:MAG: hypothetical protein GTO24_00440 [candidate division Zixibacteria bacterium]|nr:hypothetical protein [candidate division Zixibacteria bacterium]